jgi:hypothetical protein
LNRRQRSWAASRSDRHAALPREPVADDQPLAVFADLLGERRDVLLDLDLERRSDHAPGALSGQVVERDLDPLILLPDGERANICHGAFLSRLTAVGLDQPGRYAAFLLTRIHNFWV